MNRFDPRGVLAVIAVLCAFILQGYLTYTQSPETMPPWVVGLVASIVGFYFGAKKNGNGAA